MHLPPRLERAVNRQLSPGVPLGLLGLLWVQKVTRDKRLHGTNGYRGTKGYTGHTATWDKTLFSSFLASLCPFLFCFVWLGVLLGCPAHPLVFSWGPLGLSWGALGVAWVPPEVLVGTSWGHLGNFRVLENASRILLGYSCALVKRSGAF